jgi:hypothetical protein
MGSAEDLLEEAKSLVAEATRRGVILRVLGGVAIRYHCPCASQPPLARHIADIDLFGLSKDSTSIRKVFAGLSYDQAETFNALHGNRRLMFFQPNTHARRDVFLDFFEMCHKFDFRNRLQVEGFSISLSDLLMTKLQVVEIEDRDYKDIVCMFVDHELSDSDGQDTINKNYIADVCSDDWGVYKSFTQNLAKTAGYLEQIDLKDLQTKTTKERIGVLEDTIERAPKSSGWKLRSLIGARMSWYEEPEVPKTIKFAED